MLNIYHDKICSKPENCIFKLVQDQLKDIVNKKLSCSRKLLITMILVRIIIVQLYAMKIMLLVIFSKILERKES